MNFFIANDNFLLLSPLIFTVNVFLSLGNTNIITNNTEILITDIGEVGSSDGLPTLNCHTDSETCCRGIDNGGGSGLGHWHYPNGTIITGQMAMDFYRQRFSQQIRLNRITSRNPLEPTGSYCCVIPTTAGEMTFCANLGKYRYHYSYCYHLLHHNLPAVVCPSLHLMNGIVTYSDPALGVDSAAIHTCNPGYQPSGGSSRVCQSDGSWNGSSPTCEGKQTTHLR